jgi:hypothetical protein
MTEQVFDPRELGSKVLLHIREGMEVYDQNNKLVGTVEDVYLGSASEDKRKHGEGPATVQDPDDWQEDSLVEDIAEVFGPDDIPEVLRNRLLYHGFMRLDGAGLFAADRYVMPEQIASISRDRVRLNVTKDELIKR